MEVAGFMCSWGRSGPAAGSGQQIVRIVDVDDAAQLVADDGSRLRLAHIEFPKRETGSGHWTVARPEVLDWLRSRVVGQELTLDPARSSFDRGGRMLIDISIDEGQPLVAELLAEGFGILRPDLGTVTDPEKLLAAEKQARGRRSGIWDGGLAGPVDHDDAGRLIGHYGLVTGRVLQSTPTRYYVYCNFGKRWREDFTVRIPTEAARLLSRQGLDVTKLGGRKVMVRGWLFEEDGPMIEMTNRHEIEILE